MSPLVKKILFIDDDELFLELASRAVTHHADGNWEALTAASAAAGLELLQQQRVDLVAIDLHMPVCDGLQLLALLRRRFPHTARVVLTGDSSENARASSFGSGAELFLTKPQSSKEWKDVFAAFDQVLKLDHKAGFVGVLQQVSLQDVLQLACLTRRSVVLRIRTREAGGAIYIKDGEILHARCGDTIGEDAFNMLMGLPGGEFDLEQYIEPPECSIHQQWEFLLMEAARKSDEAQQDSGNSSELIALLAATARKAATERENLDTGALRRPAEAAKRADDLQPMVDEFLLCTVAGNGHELLHEWQCAGTGRRIELIEWMAAQARPLAHRLPLGEFERMEVNGPQRRLAVIADSRKLALVRTSRIAASEALERPL